MLLFVGLSSPLFFRAYCNYANDLLRFFVLDFARLYGQDKIVYNIHNLVHLAKDVEQQQQQHGVLDNFSAFIYESFLWKLKRLVRKPSFPLQKVIQRLSENNHQLPNKMCIPSSGLAKKNHSH